MLFAGGAVSTRMCPSDGQHKEDKKGRRETSEEGGRDPEPKKILDSNKVVGFR